MLGPSKSNSELDEVFVPTVGWIIFLSSFIPVHFLLNGHENLRKKLERSLVELICNSFVASWTGVVKYHGPRPSMRPKQVFVANHTSMIDSIILEQMTAFAVIMQKHPGWVGKCLRPIFVLPAPKKRQQSFAESMLRRLEE